MHYLGNPYNNILTFIVLVQFAIFIRTARKFIAELRFLNERFPAMLAAITG